MTKIQYFGRMMRERREALGLSIEKAAELCGISKVKNGYLILTV